VPPVCVSVGGAGVGPIDGSTVGFGVALNGSAVVDIGSGAVGLGGRESGGAGAPCMGGGAPPSGERITRTTASSPGTSNTYESKSS